MLLNLKMRSILRSNRYYAAQSRKTWIDTWKYTILTWILYFDWFWHQIWNQDQKLGLKLLFCGVCLQICFLPTGGRNSPYGRFCLFGFSILTLEVIQIGTWFKLCWTAWAWFDFWWKIYKIKMKTPYVIAIQSSKIVIFSLKS